MNIHHLELFYFVARYEGVSAAVRNIPYGIQQPAVSTQMAKLEQYLGVKLFNRRPFYLLPAGARLYEFVQPFFENVDRVAAEVRGLSAPQIRIAASSVVLRDYLPRLLGRICPRFPDFRLTLCETVQPMAERLLKAREVDLAITLVESKPAPGMHVKVLLDLPLILLVSGKHRLKSAAELWRRGRIEEPLITFPCHGIVFLRFQQVLNRRAIEWLPGIEVDSLELIENYVAKGYGIGLSVAVPEAKLPAGIRALPLPGFPTVKVGAIWAGKPAPMTLALLGELESESRRVGGRPKREWNPPAKLRAGAAL